MLISIVGLSGSGKSFIAKTLESYNSRIIHLDIDKVGHSAYEDKAILNEIIKSFGTSIITNNQVNRKLLSKIVFSSKEYMNKLEEITWSYMEQKIDEFINANQDKIMILDWLLIPKTKYFKMSNLRILVTASYETRLKRAMYRDNITKEKFEERENAAPSLNPSEFEYIIENENILNTQEKVRLIYDKSIIHR